MDFLKKVLLIVVAVALAVAVCFNIVSYWIDAEIIMSVGVLLMAGIHLVLLVGVFWLAYSFLAEALTSKS